MNRKMIGLLVVLLLIVAGPQSLMTSASGSTITYASDVAITNAQSDSTNLTALGNLDWFADGQDWKAGGTAISHTGRGGYCLSDTSSRDWEGTGAGSYPWFNWSDGTNNASNDTPVWLEYNDGGVTMSATITLAANTSGTISAIVVGWGDGLTYAAAFSGGGGIATTASPVGNGNQLLSLNYVTTQAETLTLTVANSGDGAGAGVLALAVSVPEPGTVALLAMGLVGLLCYAWRKRK